MCICVLCDICVYVYICICVYLCIVYPYVAHIDMCMRDYVYVYVCDIYVYAYMYVCDIYVYAYMYVCIRVCA